MTYNPTWITEDELQSEVNSVVISASSVEYEEVPTATYKTAQESIDQLESSGLISGGLIAEVDTATVSAAGGTGMMRAVDDLHAPLFFMDFPENTSIAIPADETKDIVVNYNSGTPQIEAVTPGTINANQYFLLGQVGRGAGELFVSNLRQRISDFKVRVLSRMYGTDAVVRDGNSGLIIGESGDGNRYVTMTSGTVWALLDQEDIASFNTGTGDTFIEIYRDGLGGWIETGGVTQWNMLNYDNDNVVLATLSNGRYGVRWFWLIPSDETMFGVFGTGNHKSLAEAEAEAVPDEVPSIITEYGVLIGKIIVLKNVTIAAEVSSAFDTTYNFSGTTDHGNLSNLGAPNDDHTQYSLVTGTRDFTGTVGGITPVADTDLTTKLYVDTPSITASSDYYQMTTSAAEPNHSEGLMSWDNNDHTLRIFNDIPEMAIQVGQEVVIRVRNESGSQIDYGTPVHGVGSSQGLITVEPSKADSLNNLRTTGVATHDIPNNTNGYITVIGNVRDIDTSAWSGGDTLYVSPTAAGVLTNVRPKSPDIAHATATVSISDATSGSIFAFASPADTDPMLEIVYTLPLTGVVDASIDFVGTVRIEGAGATTDIATDWAVSNQHVFINVNSITGSGDITLTGTSLPESNAVPSAGDVEILPSVSATGYLQTDNKWWEITNIDIPAGITAINFDYGVVGYPDMGNRNFRIIGYRMDAYSAGNSPDMRLRFTKVQDNGNKRMTLPLLEDIGVDSGNAGDQIIDHLRTGADDRSYNPAVADIWENDTTFSFKQLDFNTYFTADENNILGGDLHEGYVIRIEGEGAGISNVDFVTIHLFYELI